MTAAATSLPSTSSTPHNFEVASIANPTQNQKRPLGLNLTNSNTHGFPHYPVSAPSSSARPLSNQSPIAPMQRNASFSFAPATIPHNYQPPPHTLASAPPSATIPLPHSSSSIPTINQVALQSQNTGRARLPLLIPNSVSANNRAEFQAGSDTPSNHPPGSSAPSALNMPNGKIPTPDGPVVPPASLSNFPGLGFAVQSTPTPQGKTLPPSATPAPTQATRDASRFFNTYIYDYLLKQGLLDVARAFVMSGAEFDLVDGREATAGPQSGLNNTRSSNAHKRRRSEASLHNSNSSSHGTSNVYPNHDGQNSAIPKGSTTAYSNRSSNETPSSQGPNSDPATNPPAINGTNGIGACSHTSASPQSSPPDSLPSVDNLPKPKLAMDTEMGFLFEWWSIFWDVFRAKTGRAPAQSKPAHLYAQTVASLGASTESNGMSKARREAMGILAVPNPVDLQKGQLNDRIQQQFTLLNATPYDAHHQDPANVTGPRPTPHQLQVAKQVAIAEQAARQQQINRLQQQHFQRVDVNLARSRQQQAQAQHHQQQQHAQVQQQQQHHQQQQELQQRAHEMRQSQQMHQIHPGHHEQFIQQRQLPVNVRRVGMLANMGPDGMMAPPTSVTHGSPLNPHQQAYRSSRPPSRSGTVHISSPFATNQAQPPRQPSRASNHASSPAMQPHPRTPSASHASTPQPSVPHPHNRVSPIVSNGEQERKKRRLNEPVYGPHDPLTPDSSGAPPPTQPLHQLTQQQQQILAQQQQLAHHHLQQMNHQQLSPHHQHQQHSNIQNPQQQQQNHMTQMQPPRRSINPNNEFAASPSDTPPSNISAEAYKQSIHAKHNQTVSPIGASAAQKSVNVSSPSKEATNKLDEISMPPPSSRSVATQPSTPQSSAPANRTTESTPLPTIVAPSPNIKPLRPASQNDHKHIPGGPVGSITSSTDQSSVTLPPNQLLAGNMNLNNVDQKPNNATGDGQAVNLSADGSTMADHQNEKSIFSSEVDSKVKQENIWSLDSKNARSHQPNMSLTANQNSHSLTSNDLAPGNANPMDQLFDGEISFDLDACLFEAFINYDHPASDITNSDFS